ncbi:NEL-type E3 ubiquitin ligase domain-containing protein [Pseudomonas sp. NMI795_08]|uniref:NEL-type E3 ubiquitin ligase domain-containing protein n=1 Tax=Pseudomonas sp. NMI795_08 TaxID=2903144 RepID=UPI002FCDB642
MVRCAGDQASFQSAADERVATLNRHSPAGEVNRESWLVRLDSDLQLPRRQLWSRLASEAGSEDFFQLLADLHDTEDYRLQRDEMSRRVWEVIEACAQNSELRERLFDMAMQPTSCADSIALTFSLLEVQSWVYLRTAGLSGQVAEPELLRLGRSLFRLDAVDRAAGEDIEQRIQARDDVDEVEVRLAYRVRLAETLGLPGQPTTMRYPVVAQVSGARLLQVRGQVLTAERTQLAQSVAARSFWRDHLRQTYSVRFEALDQPFYLELEALDARLTSLPEGDYLAEVERIALRRDTAQANLFETLTQEALARYPL